MKPDLEMEINFKVPCSITLDLSTEQPAREIEGLVCESQGFVFLKTNKPSPHPQPHPRLQSRIPAPH